jgi:exodeoxyribonuclease VII large subunit
MIDPALSEARVWSVGALCHAIADALDARFNPIIVKGEISGFSRAGSGHCYFVLKDAAGQLRCAMFRRAAINVGFDPRDGDRVEIRAKVSVYEPRGELQLIVEAMSRSGQGSLFEQFLLLKEKLQAQGLFNQERKRPIATLPRGIGLVTSMGAAALHDVVIALQRRAPHIPVVLAPALVQGEQAAKSLIAALEALYCLASKPQNECTVDTILLVRGGGSMEDLWAFNDEALAYAIAASPVPVVSGVGHETDFTIADFVADLRAPTPTAAAELAATSNQELMESLRTIQSRVQHSTERCMDRQQQRLDGLVARLGRPSHYAQLRAHALATIKQRMQTALRSRIAAIQSDIQGKATVLQTKTQLQLSRHRSNLHTQGIRLEGQDPRKVLTRGYAWLSNQEGVAVGQIRQVKTGEKLLATLQDGTVDLRVESLRPN